MLSVVRKLLLFVFRTNHPRVGGAENETCNLEASDITEGKFAIRQCVQSPIQHQSLFAQFLPHTNEPPRLRTQDSLIKNPKQINRLDGTIKSGSMWKNFQ